MKELLRRKAKDYGYGSLAEMARAWGMDESSVRRVANGEYGLSLEMRRKIVKELDVDPAVLEEVVGR